MVCHSLLPCSQRISVFISSDAQLSSPCSRKDDYIVRDRYALLFLFAEQAWRIGNPTELFIVDEEKKK